MKVHAGKMEVMAVVVISLFHQAQGCTCPLHNSGTPKLCKIEGE